ncbi:Tether containing UBX domain for GLUT4 [Nymphon striatum]|nr:Tether containing UBX domain for GLUT4 [Nymphon striatum]
MSSTVVILCPNGRRQTVHTTLNASLLSILEEVCQKQSLDSKQYQLRHNKTILDLSLNLRYTNLPNNCKLEIEKIDFTRKEGKIKVRLELESGEKLISEFLPNESLYQVITIWKEKIQNDLNDSTKEPILIYIRNEFVGTENLKTVNLRKLGLTSGNAAFRLINKRTYYAFMDFSKAFDKNDCKLLFQKLQLLGFPRNFYQLIFNILNNLNFRVYLPFSLPPATVHFSSNLPINCLLYADDTCLIAETADNLQSSLDSLTEYYKINHLGYSIVTRRNVATQPVESPIVDKNSDPDETMDDLALLNVSTTSSTKECQNKNFVDETEQISCQNLDSMDVDNPEAQEVVSVYNKQLPSCSWSGSIVENAMEDKEGEEEEEANNVYIEDRNAMLFDLEDIPPISHADLPDDFYKLDGNDITLLYQDLMSKCTDLQDKPLVTEKMRQNQKLMQLRKYKKCFLDVYDFVKSFLDEDISTFHLFTTPPKSILNLNSKLSELNLVPTALLYFGFNEKRMHYLRDEYLNNFFYT